MSDQDKTFPEQLDAAADGEEFAGALMGLFAALDRARGRIVMCVCDHLEHEGPCQARVFHCYQCDWERCGCEGPA